VKLQTPADPKKKHKKEPKDTSGKSPALFVGCIDAIAEGCCEEILEKLEKSSICASKYEPKGYL